MRLWKLDAKLKSFSLVGTIPAPGVINSLQLITLPRETIEAASWTGAITAGSKQNGRRPKVDPIMLVAGMGQELKFGRWLSVKGDGAANGALVVALSPRTLI